MPEKMTMDVRIRLSAMMFFQFMLIAVFWVPLSAYLNTMKDIGTWLPTILSTMALGCLASPLIGMFADRHFSSERVLAVLNLLTGGLLIVAGTVTSPLHIFIVLLFAMLCYMPTWGLTSAIAMSHSPSDKFPQVRVFGSIGWVAAGLFSLAAGWFFKDKIGEALKIDGTAIPFYCGGAVALVAAIHSMFLPHTPPPAKGQPASVIDALGLRSLSLLKDPQFALLIIGTLLATIPFAAHWSYGSAFLADKGFEYLTFTMNLGQFVEMFLMLLVPIAIAAFGLKWTIIIGLATLAVRYAAYMLGGIYEFVPLYYIAILVHGIIFGFFYVGGQIFVDRRAPKEMRAQAQGLLFLLSFGIGLLIGNYFCDALITSGTAENGERNYHLLWVVCTVSSGILAVILALTLREPPTGDAEAEPVAEAPAEAPLAEAPTVEMAPGEPEEQA